MTALALVDADKRRILSVADLGTGKTLIWTDVGGVYAWLPAPTDDDAPEYDPEADAYAAEQLTYSVTYPD